MKYGISVYTGTEYSLEDNKNYITMASEQGIAHVFTSLHLPEVNYKEQHQEIMKLLSFIKDLNMKLTVDISPAAMNLLGASVSDLLPFSQLGIDVLRLDYGFNMNEIIEMSCNPYQLDIELNASTLTREQLESLKEGGAYFNSFRACHNFYPRPYTGLSIEFFKDKSEMLAKYGLNVAAFIPSQYGKRGPLFEGLPTLEMHRGMPTHAAAKYFVYSGLIDILYFGDSYASREELKNVANIEWNKIIELDIELVDGISDEEKSIILTGTHTNRMDASDYIIRSAESRGYAQIGKPIKPHHCYERTKYCITIDNIGYKRYSGELQICRTELPADNRVNVAGYICRDDHSLLDYIQCGTAFSFKVRG